MAAEDDRGQRNDRGHKEQGLDLICLLGPTVTGKTRVAVGVARELDGEIISADSRQVYRHMNLGTGKDLEEYRTGGCPVPYHLIDLVEPGSEFSVFDFQGAFLQAYTGIRRRNRLPILCGGSGMYLDAVLRRYRLVDAPRREELRAELDRETRDELVARLASLRPLHNTTDLTDRERLIRAIEIATHGREVSPGEDSFPALNTRTYGLSLERRILKKRITERLRARLKQGMVEEVRNLLERGLTPERLEFYGLEYRFLTRYVLGRLSRNDMFQKLNGAIFQFAKRQEKWFRWMERKGISIIWLDGRKPVEDLVRAIVDDLPGGGGIT